MKQQRYYAHYKKDNNQLLGWYITPMHKVIPTPNLEVTKEVWEESIKENYNKVDLTKGSLFLYDFRSSAQKVEGDRVASKFILEAAIKKAEVYYKDNLYQADKDSLAAMNTTIGGLEEGETCLWKVSNNTVVEVSMEDLKKVLRLGVKERARLVEEQGNLVAQ